MCLKRNVKKKIVNHVRNQIWKKKYVEKQGTFQIRHSSYRHECWLFALVQGSDLIDFYNAYSHLTHTCTQPNILSDI